ncbi:MAG TPA: hypothetical protein VE572_01800, partial [Nitrososphaeraceae archaeon]|nr:hypothetical protein [Nitrososphaeraceae archaeon]
MKTNILVIMALIASIALLSTAIPYANAALVPSTVEIIGVCGLLIAPPGTIDYGVLAPNEVSTP